MKRYKKFPLIDIWGALLNTISWQLPAIMLGAFFSPVIVGLYALGNTVIRMPMSTIGSSIAQVFYQKSSEAKLKGNIPTVVEHVLRRLVAYSIFPILVLCLVGKDLFVIVFGDKWADAGVYSQILAPWMFFTFISSPLSTLFSVYERQGSVLIIQISILVTRVVSLYIGGIMGNVYVSLALFSASGVVVYGILCLWNLSIARIRSRIFWESLFRNSFIFIPACLVIFLLKYVFMFSSLIILVISFFMVIFYELYIVSTDDEIKSYLYFLRGNT